jgi:DDE superfamily endonuclease
MSHSDPIIAILAQFRPLFTAPTWKKMMTLLTGTLLARGRRTVTAALWQTGHHLDSNFSRFHQVLNRARWSPLELSRHLLFLIIESFIQAGGGIDVVIDETLERRWGAKISKRGHYRDSALSSRKRSVSSPGLRLPRHGRSGHAALDAATLGLALSVCPGNHSSA